MCGVKSAFASACTDVRAQRQKLLVIHSLANVRENRGGYADTHLIFVYLIVF